MFHHIESTGGRLGPQRSSSKVVLHHLIRRTVADWRQPLLELGSRRSFRMSIEFSLVLPAFENDETIRADRFLQNGKLQISIFVTTQLAIFLEKSDPLGDCVCRNVEIGNGINRSSVGLALCAGRDRHSDQERASQYRHRSAER